MNIETILGQIRSGTVPEVGRVLQEAVGKPVVEGAISEKAKEIAGAKVQGQELIDLARSKMATEIQAVAAADSASREQKGKQAEGRKRLGETIKGAGGDVLTFGKAALGISLSEDEVDILGAVGRGERKLPIQEAASAFAEMAKYMAEAAKQRIEISKARGELRNVPLGRDQVFVDRMETSEQKVVEAGLRIVVVLDKKPRMLDDLKEANAIHHGFDRAERSVGRALGRLADRLTKRYPNEAGEIQNKKSAIEDELKRKGVEATVAVEVTMEQKVSFVKESVASLGIEGADVKKWYAEKLGLKTERDQNGNEVEVVTDGSLADILLGVGAEKKALETDSAKALEAAHDDPRLADEALSFALMEFSASSGEKIGQQKLEQLWLQAQAKEDVRLAVEYAKLSGSKLLKNLADGYDSMVSLAARNVAVAEKVIGRAVGVTGIVVGGAVAVIGGLMMIPGAIVAGTGVLTGAGGFGAERLANRVFGDLRDMVAERRTGRHEVRSGEITDLEKQKADIEAKLARLRGGNATGG